MRTKHTASQRILIVFVGAFGFCYATFAHHSDAGIDDKSVVSLQGKVTEFSWRQPHVYLSVEVMENNESVI